LGENKFLWKPFSYKLFWNCKLLIPTFFVKSFFFFSILDRQPTVKIYRQNDTMHIYRLIPRNKHFHVVCIREGKNKPPKSDWLEWYQKKTTYSPKPNVLGISR
jgi:hypothetical protein